MLRTFIYLFSAFLVNNCLQAQSVKQTLPTVNPIAAGYNSSFFPNLSKKLSDSIPSLGSFLVWSHGAIVYEGYYHEASDSTSFDIKSITKSMVSSLAGIARSKGLLPDLNSPVLNLLPEYAKSGFASSTVWFAHDKEIYDSIRSTLTLRDLLTMQPGFQWSDFGPVVNAFVNSSDPVRFALDLPFEDEPGTKFVYCSAAASVFSAALAKCLSTDLKSFADSNLFAPAGISLKRWDTDPIGRYVGASEMYMTSKDLLRFGLIYLHQGKVESKQLIPEDWIKESTKKQAELKFWDVLPHADGYGYFWWRRKTNGHQAYIASGAGGQLIAVIPDLDMVVVATCFLNEKNRGRSEIKRLHFFIDKVTKVSK